MGEPQGISYFRERRIFTIDHSKSPHRTFFVLDMANDVMKYYVTWKESLNNSETCDISAAVPRDEASKVSSCTIPSTLTGG